MKNLLILAALLFAHGSFAQGFTKLEAGDYALSNANARVLSVGPICGGAPGEITCMAIGSVVTLRVQLQGCLDSFGGYFYEFAKQNRKTVLKFGAINVANKKSLAARCAAMPEETVRVYTSEEIDEVVLKQLNYVGATR